jgi:shikimate kinase
MNMNMRILERGSLKSSASLVLIVARSVRSATLAVDGKSNLNEMIKAMIMITAAGNGENKFNGRRTVNMKLRIQQKNR